LAFLNINDSTVLTPRRLLSVLRDKGATSLDC